jgi:transcription-repair coupling factor (superfamily II helicase)
MPGGIEYYLPLFFEQTATLFDYLPDDTLAFEAEPCARRRQTPRRHRGPLRAAPPRPGAPAAAAARRLYLAATNSPAAQRPPGVLLAIRRGAAAAQGLRRRLQLRHRHAAGAWHPGPRRRARGGAEGLPRRARPAHPVRRREHRPARDAARQPARLRIRPRRRRLAAFADGDLPPRRHRRRRWSSRCCCPPAPAPRHRADHRDPALRRAVRQERRRKARERDGEAVVRNLTELHEGAPVVHEEHGVGRFLGLQTMQVGGSEVEFLALEYANGDKLYVPVSSLHLISRYTGAAAEERAAAPPGQRPMGQGQAQGRAEGPRRGRRAAGHLRPPRRPPGRRLPRPRRRLRRLRRRLRVRGDAGPAARHRGHPQDMADPKPMDRVVCGDVGFGKTEVAMRAAFVAVNAGARSPCWCPPRCSPSSTTRTSPTASPTGHPRREPVALQNTKETKAILDGLAKGTVDIVVGTHKLLQPSVRFKDLGLAIIDEEHRFGVRHKERSRACAARSTC